MLRCHINYYNELRARLSLDKDASSTRAIQSVENIVCRLVLDSSVALRWAQRLVVRITMVAPKL